MKKKQNNWCLHYIWNLSKGIANRVSTTVWNIRATNVWRLKKYLVKRHSFMYMAQIFYIDMSSKIEAFRILLPKYKVEVHFGCILFAFWLKLYQWASFKALCQQPVLLSSLICLIRSLVWRLNLLERQGFRLQKLFTLLWISWIFFILLWHDN